MSVFTEGEVAYLRSHTMGRLATVGRDGQPHIVPLTFHYNADDDTIDLGGVDFANSKKWRDMQHDQHITFLVDDFAPTEAHAVEVRGRAELHETGGNAINPRFPNFVPQFVRLRPSYIVSWGVNTSAQGAQFQPEGRRVNR